MALLAYGLLAFSGIAALALKMLHSASPNHPVETSSPTDSPRAPDGAHLRELAEGLRVLARRCRYAGTRRELLQLAARFDRRADHFDAHQSPPLDTDASGV
jgi:hypothetical protein